MSDPANDPAIAWISQRIPAGRAVVVYVAARIPTDASPATVIGVANRATGVVQRNLDTEPLSAGQVATTFVAVPMHEVPTEVFDDGHDRSVDLAVVTIAHMPEGVWRPVGVSGRQEYTFPPLGWEDQ